jgi:hypothetical protein
LSVPPLILKNEGGKLSNDITINVLSNYPISYEAFDNKYPLGRWEYIVSIDEGIYKFKNIFKYMEINPKKYLNPGEVWTLNCPSIIITDLNQEIELKLEIFYGTETPLIRNLTLTTK